MRIEKEPRHSFIRMKERRTCRNGKRKTSFYHEILKTIRIHDKCWPKDCITLDQKLKILKDDQHV